MVENTQIRKWRIVGTFIVGVGLIGIAVYLDQNIWPSVFLELGAAVALVGVLFVVERGFLQAVKVENQATVERVADIVESAAPVAQPDELVIDIVPMATDRGQAPRMLVRITDPGGDYRTEWKVTLESPSGKTYSAVATWPGAGRIFRARFATPEPRTGTWFGAAVRNGSVSYPIQADLA